MKQQQQQQQMNEPLMRPGEENWRGEGFMTADDAANGAIAIVIRPVQTV